MNSKKALSLRWLLMMALAVTLCVLAGYTIFRYRTKTEEEMYKMVKNGMHRTEVERIIGKPDIDGEHEVFYGKPPEIMPWQSPVSPGSIRIEYSADNIVLRADYYGNANIPESPIIGSDQDKDTPHQQNGIR